MILQNGKYFLILKMKLVEASNLFGCKGKTKKFTRGRSSVWLERLPVTQEVASSSLVGPAPKTHKVSAFC